MSFGHRTILAINAGSSSVKLAVFTMKSDSADLSRVVDISINDIGQLESTLTIARADVAPIHTPTRTPDHVTATYQLFEQLAAVVPLDTISAIGHRLVHGGPKFSDTTDIQAIGETDWELLTRLDPQHTSAARRLVRATHHLLPTIPQIACFDTSFFHDLPRVAQLVPIPQKYSAQGVRRYGFHGLSYTSVLSSFRTIAGEVAGDGRVIIAHLGSGASLTALRHGQPVDTTMGLTPTSGVVMSTRSGDLDPNLFSFLRQQTDLSVEEFDHMVNFESGLLGISGVSADMRTLLAIEDENPEAKLAVDAFVSSVQKAIGALSTTIGGLDSLIFSGGIGEQSDVLRERICSNLSHLGVILDNQANKQHAALISAPTSPAGVHVIPADEAKIIANQTALTLNKIRA